MPTSRAEARTDVPSPEPSPDSRPAATAAAGHREGSLVESATQPGLDDLVPLAGDERDDPDAGGGDHLPHRPRDRPADERLDSELGQARPHPAWRARGEHLVRLEDDPAGFGLDDEKVAGGVEDGCDPAAPAGEGRSRSVGGSVLVHVIEGASSAPAPAESSSDHRTRSGSTKCVASTGSARTPRSSVVAPLLGGYGSTRATPLDPEPTGRLARGDRCRACGSSGRASSCGCLAPSRLRGG